MASLQIRKLPQAIYTALKLAAARERRSLSQQAIIALAKGLDVQEGQQERRRQVLAKIKNESNRWKHLANIDVAGWVREDRESR